MKGRYRIELYNATVHYCLLAERNITILQGNSATGKTELIRLLTEYNERKESSGITLICDKTCSVLTSDDWQYRMAGMRDRIIFIDEGNSFVRSKEFAEALRGSDNYFVIISRDDLYELPYSIHEIYGLRETSGEKYRNAQHVYNEMYQLYTADSWNDVTADRVITEGSGSGFQFFQTAFPGMTLSSDGKGNILRKLREAAARGENTQNAAAKFENL